MIVTAASFFGFAWGFAAFSVSKRRCRLFTPARLGRLFDIRTRCVDTLRVASREPVAFHLRSHVVSQVLGREIQLCCKGQCLCRKVQ